MKYNTSSEFAGINSLKKKHKWQIDQFESWAKRNEWINFHQSHYDWWVFPISRKSSFGYKWTVLEGEIFELKKDEHFIMNYLRGVELVAASWGWDLMKSEEFTNPDRNQNWHKWPIRLYKAAQSTRLFGYEDMFSSLQKYAEILINRGESMVFRGKDLSWIFKPDHK
jgi:hypothetical protein